MHQALTPKSRNQKQKPSASLCPCRQTTKQYGHGTPLSQASQTTCLTLHNSQGNKAKSPPPKIPAARKLEIQVNAPTKTRANRHQVMRPPTYEGSLLIASQRSRLRAQSGPKSISLVAFSTTDVADIVSPLAQHPQFLFPSSKPTQPNTSLPPTLPLLLPTPLSRTTPLRFSLTIL